MELINGGLAVDDRGSVTFVNDFDFKGVKRFYMVQNHEKGFVRAWHGHKKESKYVLVTRGTIRLIVVNMYNTDEQEEYILSDKKPQILYIPAGFYNGFQTLTDDAQVMFFSTTTLEESKDDDYREKWNKFNDWEKDYR
jgi:dTDP-4-dehydrorhamnose 3,5-epimerase